MNVKCYKKGYPRPQFVRDNFISLSGEWDFLFDDRNEGEKGKWYAGFPAGKKIKVPFAYEAPASGIGESQPHNYVWYSRELKADRLASGTRAVLWFEGCDYMTKLWVNGIFCGQHRGAYSRFSFDITDCLNCSGINNIVIKAEDFLDAQQVRGKQRWYDGGYYSCYYTQTTGIWKDVWLEYVNESHIKSVKVTPVLDEYRVRFEFETSRNSENLECELEINLNGKPVSITRNKVLRDTFNMTIDITSEAVNWKVAEWTPENPVLYDTEYRLYDKGRLIDRVGSYFGFREVKCYGNSVLLNRAPYYQKLVLNQGYWPETHLTPPSEDALITDLEAVKKLGYNGVRMHQKIEDERFFYYADTMGVIVWCEMPSAYEYGERMTESFTAEWQKVIKQYYNHPSIFVWVPFNESWGVQRIHSDKSQQRFSEAIYYFTKAYDIMRPVISNDGWEHTKSDIITLHNYTGSGEEMLRQYKDLISRALNNSNCNHSHKMTFADGYRYDGQPVMVSEYGGIAFKTSQNGEWGYGDQVTTEQQFLERFERLTSAIKTMDAVCGFCYTQLTDVQQEVNGLLTGDRKEKIPAGKIKQIN